MSFLCSNAVMVRIVILLMVFMASEANADSGQRISIIVNKNSPVKSMNSQEVRALFTMAKRSWDTGNPVILVITDQKSEEYTQFCLKILDQLPYRVIRNWERKIYTGIARSPVTVDGYKEAISYVENNPDAIGFIISDEIPLPQGVREVYAKN